jgi:S1-C subfamily serine protease
MIVNIRAFLPEPEHGGAYADPVEGTPGRLLAQYRKALVNWHQTSAHEAAAGVKRPDHAWEAARELGRRTGLRVAQVGTGSPAAQAGLRVGDIVLAVDGQEIATSTGVQQRMVEAVIGRRVELTVWRNGALVTSSPSRAN